MTEPDLSFEDFFTAHRRNLWHLAIAVTGNPSQAEDAIQDVFARLFQHWGRVRAMERPDLYARRAVINAATSARRKRIPAPLFLAANESDFSDRVVDRSTVVAAVRMLPKRQRSVVALRYLERLTDSEIAEVLGCTPATVRSNASRGLRALRVALAAEYARDAEGTENG